MKIFALLGVSAFAKECYEAVLPLGGAAERGDLSSARLKLAVEEFATCAERDSAHKA